MNSRATVWVAGIVAWVSSLAALAQPSGGPYGPVQQTYTVPANAGRVHHVAPNGEATANGSSLEDPTSLAAAMARTVTGDVIVLRGGTYRTGDLKFNQGMSPSSAQQDCAFPAIETALR
jgi:hypothetical protein